MKLELECKINTIEKVKMFADIATQCKTADIVVMSDKYIVDGKSVLGLFSLDITSKVTVTIESKSETEIDTFYSNIKKAGCLIE